MFELIHVTSITHVTLSITAFPQENKDIVELGGAGHICNLRHMIGVPIADERLHLIAAANNGLQTSFETAANPISGDTANRLVDVAKTTCHVQKNQDGVWIGDCEDCCKRLGRNCPGALWVRSRHDQLDKSLEESRKVPADKNGDPMQSTRRGNCSGCCTSGPAKSTRKHRQIYPMASGLQPHFDSLKHEDLAAIVSCLCLMPRIDGTAITPRIVRQQRRHCLEHLISEFLEQPQAARARTFLAHTDNQLQWVGIRGSHSRNK